MSSSTEVFSTSQWQRLQKIFHQALDQPSGERTAFIAQACGDDERLKNQVEALVLAADSDQELVGGLISSAAGQMLGAGAAARKQIGTFKVLDIIGTGGMGVVFLAQRDDDEFQQQVAIKILHDGMAGEETQRRFLAERQILADLNHPNIARLLDGGHTDDGQPYLVMEYIDGEPLNEYCDRLRLSVEERLRIFQQVCYAVAAAHRALVVHRDIKPSNILVGADGVPKLLDFGIAKVLNNRLRAVDLAKTQLGDRLLTPGNASPEQVMGRVITTASDIYSLGVLLYQLLCGSRPLQLVGLTPAEMERVICDEIPAPPSQAIGMLAERDDEAQQTAARYRGTTPAKLSARLRGELDKIVLMALKKEPQRRYTSADQFAADIDRHLAGLPVVAANDTRRYRAAKFIVRNKVAVVAASAFVLALSVFSLATYFQAREIAAQSVKLEAEKNRLEDALDFLTTVFQAANPLLLQKKTPSARDLLDVGDRMITQELMGRPAIRGRLQRAIGTAYASQDVPEKALSNYQGALEANIAVHGADHPYVADVLQNLGKFYWRSDWSKSAQYYQRAMDILRGAPAARYFANNPAKHQAAIQNLLRDMAELNISSGAWGEAETSLKEALAIAEGLQENSSYAAEEAYTLRMLGALQRRLNHYDDSERSLQRALAIFKRLRGERHTTVADILEDLAATAHARGDLNAAQRYYQESFAIREAVFGIDDVKLIPAKADLGRFLRDYGDLNLAKKYLTEVVDVSRATFGESSYELGFDMVELAKVHSDLGEFERAESLLVEALQIYTRTIGTEHAFYAEALRQFGNLMKRTGDLGRSLDLFDDALAVLEKRPGPLHWQTAACMSEKADVLLLRGEVAAAAELLQGALPVLDKALGKNHRLYLEANARLLRAGESQE